MTHHLLAVLASATALAAQTTVAIPCARDNTLYEHSLGALSNATGGGIFVGLTGQPVGSSIRRAVVFFDVAASVPAGARIISAALTVNVSQSNFGSPPIVIVQGHRLLQDWGEGTSFATGGFGGGGAGGAATPGDATWLHTFFPGSIWTNAGGDFAATPSLSLAAPQFGPVTSPVQGAVVGDVQSWLDNPVQNFGWLLKSDELGSPHARRLDSRENLAGSPPVLTVTYLTNGQVTTFGTGCPVGGSPFLHGWSGPPIGGTTIQLTQTNGPPNQLGANLLSLAFVPQGVLLPANCLYYLPLTASVNLGLFNLGATGSGSTTFNVPAGFPGVLIASQTAALDSNNPAGFVLSNAALALLQ